MTFFHFLFTANTTRVDPNEGTGDLGQRQKEVTAYANDWHLKRCAYQPMSSISGGPYGSIANRADRRVCGAACNCIRDSSAELILISIISLVSFIEM